MERRRVPGTMRATMLCASWNVNGLRAIAKKGMREWLLEFSPDVLLLQETKAGERDVPPELRDVPGYSLHLHPAKRPGYSGVGAFVKTAPDEWIEGIGDEAFDSEGRVLFARYGTVLIGSVYFPNSQEKGKRLDHRLAFGAALRKFLAAQRRKRRHIVLGGDFNVAHEEIDIARPKQNVTNAGFLPEERDWMTRFLASGYVDTWRRRHPSVRDTYSWWSYRFSARQKNIGWRLDYFCVDEGLWPRVQDARILTAVEGSDHCPVTLEFRLPRGR